MAWRGSRAGRYRQVIDIYDPTPVERDSVGDERTEPVMVYPGLRCDVNSGRGREFEIARQQNAAITHLITARYRPGMDTAALAHMRLTFAGRDMRIEYATIKDETNREIYIAATEVTNQ